MSAKYAIGKAVFKPLDERRRRSRISESLRRKNRLNEVFLPSKGEGSEGGPGPPSDLNKIGKK